MCACARVAEKSRSHLVCVRHKIKSVSVAEAWLMAINLPFNV